MLGATALLPAVAAAWAVAGAPEPWRSAAFSAAPFAAIAAVVGGVLLAVRAGRPALAALGAAAAVGFVPPLGRLVGWPGAPPFPDEPEARPALTLRFPFDGAAHVLHGGPLAAQNPHRHDAARRFALDLAPPPTLQGPGDPAAAGGWGQPVRAPTDGRVVFAASGAPDDGAGSARAGHCSPGNHVVIRREDGVHVVVAHLRADARLPSPGAAVRAGDLLGPLGRSGHRGEVHLHLHAQSAPPGHPLAVGLPFAFTDATHISGPGGPLPVGGAAVQDEVTVLVGDLFAAPHPEEALRMDPPPPPPSG